jgi:uncharacterized membrane protein
MLGILEQWTIHLAAGIEAGAAVLIGFASVEAILGALGVWVRRAASHSAGENVRLRLGRWLALALEFELAADILRTAIVPSWNEIGQVGAIIVLRTVLNFFLQQEIEKAAASQAYAGR